MYVVNIHHLNYTGQISTGREFSMLVNQEPSQQSCKEEYETWKWGATTRHCASPTKTMLQTRKSVPRSSMQSHHTKTSWPWWRNANCRGMDMFPVHQVWPKPLCKARCKGEEDKADRRRGGKTTPGNGQAWSSSSPRGQWRTEKNGGNWLRNVSQRPPRLRDRLRWRRRTRILKTQSAVYVLDTPVTLKQIQVIKTDIYQ